MDKLTETRQMANELINLYQLEEGKNLVIVLNPPEMIIDSMYKAFIIATKEISEEKMGTLYKSLSSKETYDQLSYCEKLTLALAIAAITDAHLGSNALVKLKLMCEIEGMRNLDESLY